ncbi:MAG: hypothetical protein UE790_04090 [Lachnospira sp.]|jgi:hypothetical protein|nr:hypothetical protein [Lachnospira sp.]
MTHCIIIMMIMAVVYFITAFIFLLTKMMGVASVIKQAKQDNNADKVYESDNIVKDEHDTDKLAGVGAIGRCPKCFGAVAFITNPNCCGTCGNGLVWKRENNI